MVFGLPAAILAALAVVIGMQGAGGGGGGGGGEPPGVPVDPVELAERVSCTPEALIVAGCDGADAPSLLAAIEESVTAPLFISACEQFETLNGQRNELKGQIHRYGQVPDVVAQYQTVDAAYQAAKASRATLMQQMRSEIVNAAGQMSGVDGGLLASMMTNARRDVPAQYRVLTLSDDDWRKLNFALAQPDGVELDSATQAVLNAANASAAVAAAAIKLNDEFTMEQIESAYVN